MRIRILAAIVGVASLAVWSAACDDFHWDMGLCEDDDDCEYQVAGTRCISNRCHCTDPTERVCCPDTTIRCDASELQCRPRTFCDEPPLIVLAAPGAPCEAPEDCRGPVDPRCGAVLCDAGKCRFEIQAGERTPNQYLGDCQVNICNYDGDVVQPADGTDFPIGNLCAYGVCDGTKPIWSPISDGYPCLNLDGICVQGHCKDCSEVIGYVDCPGELICDLDTCVPASCKDGILNGQETDTDCGGPSWPSCRRCEPSQACLEGNDCTSSVCKEGVCQKPTHDDGVQNGNESGVDCGYPWGPLHLCKDGDGCRFGEDCLNSVCYFGKCLAPTCTDDRQNGTEVGIDCGGDICPPCPPESK